MRILYLPHSYSQQRQYEKPSNIYPVRMAMEAEWYRKQGHNVIWPSWKHESLDTYLRWGKEDGYDKALIEPEWLPFLSLPHPDRIFTRAKEYTSGNYKYLPGTHILSAKGCWHGRCTFCVEQGIKYEIRQVESVIEEIKECKQLGFREVFDDSATFPIGGWLDEFCTRIKEIGIVFSCNFRIIDMDYRKLRESNFRMLLVGVESANETTLDRIQKGIKVKDIIPFFKKASKAGLELHATAIIGFPWENYKDTMRTINLIKYLLIKGYANTAQMSFYVPPKGQELGNDEYRKYVTKFYEVGFNPLFWYNKIINIKSIEDLHYLIRGIQKGFNSLLKRRLT